MRDSLRPVEVADESLATVPTAVTADGDIERESWKAETSIAVDTPSGPANGHAVHALIGELQPEERVIVQGALVAERVIFNA